MFELRLSGNDGIYLFLESSSGEKYRLLIDESLQNALRHADKGSASSVSLSPREIQSEIRSGTTVDALVAKSGDPRHFIEKFAAPVLDELSHVINSAKGVRISIAGDRHTDISQIEFGDIISSRLDASGVSEFSWSARRDEQQVWLVSVNFVLDSQNQRATWSFEPKRLLLSPENELAVKLSTQNSLVEQKYSPLKAAPESVVEAPPQGITQSLADTQLVETVIPIGRASEITAHDVPEETDESVEPPTDLLEALKKKREERTSRDAELVEPEATTQSIEIIDAVGEESQEVEEDIAPNPSPVRRTNRPSIPSFDEIVQGTKSEDE
jgi:hypothetical protein